MGRSWISRNKEAKLSFSRTDRSWVKRRITAKNAFQFFRYYPKQIRLSDQTLMIPCVSLHRLSSRQSVIILKATTLCPMKVCKLFRNIQYVRLAQQRQEWVPILQNCTAGLPMSYKMGPRWNAVTTRSDFKSEAIFGFLSPNYTWKST